MSQTHTVDQEALDNLLRAKLSPEVERVLQLIGKDPLTVTAVLASELMLQRASFDRLVAHESVDAAAQRVRIRQSRRAQRDARRKLTPV